MNTRVRHRHLLPSVLPFFLFLALLCGSKAGPAQAVENCTTLLTGRCETCHYLTRVCDKVAEDKGKWSWKRTVKNMVKQGAKLSDAEQDTLVNCLSQPAPEVVQLCDQKK